MFSIGNISTHLIDTMLSIVQNAWTSPEVGNYITSLVNAVPMEKRDEIKAVINHMIKSMWVQKLATKQEGETTACTITSMLTAVGSPLAKSGSALETT